jgi:chromosome segregation ATPase
VISRAHARSAPDRLDLAAEIGRLARCDDDLASVATELTGLRDELRRLNDDVAALSLLPSDRERALVASEPELARLEAERSAVRREADATAAELREARVRLREHGDSLAMLRRELAALRADADEHHHALAEKDEALIDLEHERARAQQRAEAAAAALEQARARCREYAARTGSLEEEVHALRLRLLEGDGTPYPELESTAGHLRCLRLQTGYRLVESDEPCPAHGDGVDMDGHPFVVAVIGPAPIPGDSRPCAYLVPA